MAGVTLANVSNVFGLPPIQDLSRIAASPSVSEEDFHATFLKALGRSGLETR